MRNKKTESQDAIKIALAGNPNVGKSTLFNTLTGMRAHTGNWAGKTVECESATRKYNNCCLHFIDIPGTYSLFSHSEEEKIARDYICFGESDLTVVVCDGGALMQNLNLVLQITETGRKCIVCINFVSEAEKRGVTVNADRLSEILSVPVIPIEAHKKKSVELLLSKICTYNFSSSPHSPKYPEPIEAAAEKIKSVLLKMETEKRQARWLSLRLLDAEGEFFSELTSGFSETEQKKILEAKADASLKLSEAGISEGDVDDIIVESIVNEAERIAKEVTKVENKKPRDQKIDKILTGKITAYPLMLLFVFLVFWITLSLANYPSMLLSDVFSFAEEYLMRLFIWLKAPNWLSGALISGIFRTLGQVVSVMLPPMVIFFPLFALLEDSGYLPRIAYNLDRPFACAGACGKQALTMCMGFGCNAVGIVGCRIIDSNRERKLAILTNSLVPCNGRLPMLITLITVFCLFFTNTVSSMAVAVILCIFILLGILMTFISTALLSKTVLRGERASFTIELPPYRKPRFFSVILHSLKDKCLSVLGRAVIVAAPMGLVIWVLANIYIGNISLISYISDFLSPVGKLMGLDGVILLAFLLGLPANEIVIPLMLMIYSSEGAIGADMGIEAIRSMFIGAGWSGVTALCAIIFCLFHFPCSTSLITVYKETKSKKMTLLAFLLPTVIGFSLCVLLNLFASLLI